MNKIIATAVLGAALVVSGCSEVNSEVKQERPNRSMFTGKNHVIKLDGENVILVRNLDDYRNQNLTIESDPDVDALILEGMWDYRCTMAISQDILGKNIEYPPFCPGRKRRTMSYAENQAYNELAMAMDEASFQYAKERFQTTYK